MKTPQSRAARNPVASSRKASSSVTVIGSGNWGTSLIAALDAAAIPIDEVVLRAVPPRQPRGSRSTTMEKASLGAAILWLCVPDGAIESTTKELVQRRKLQGLDLRNQIVIHSSGVLTVDVLASAVAAGARTASVHPLMTFPTRRRVSLEGVPFAIESEPSLQRRFFAMARRLGGDPFRIRAEDKILYHAAAIMASSLLLSCLMAALQTAELAGMPANQAAGSLGRMAAATLANYLARGAEHSFSGPLARGDVATIQLHLQALVAHPILADSYRSLTRNAVECLPVRNKAEILRLLGESSPSKRRGSAAPKR
jgi:predicted short-subunit dehydrogenase-like oxidoreductase (DUF2520 family)